MASKVIMTLIIRTPDTVQVWTLDYDEGMRRMNFLRQFHKQDVKNKFQYEFSEHGRVIEDLRLPPMSDIMDELRLKNKYPGGKKP